MVYFFEDLVRNSVYDGGLHSRNADEDRNYEKDSEQKQRNLKTYA